MKRFAFILLTLIGVSLFADNIDYAVANWGGAEVRRAGDGTIFLNYNYSYVDRFFSTDAYSNN